MYERSIFSRAGGRLAAALIFSAVSLPVFSQDADLSRPPPVVPTFERIDAHAHVYSASPQFFEMLRRLNMRVINIAVVNKHRSFDQREIDLYKDAQLQNQTVLSVFRKSEGRAPWISTFDPSGWETPGFSDRVNKSLDKTFDDGAVGVKIYKSIGMELKSKKTGRYLMPDDPVFDPIFEHIAARGKTLYAHIAEPAFEWLPLEPNDPIFKGQDPFWNINGHPDRPAKAAIIAARDHMLAKHPTLRVVGCHLGSLEDDVDELAERLDRYPNFAADMAGRVKYLMLQPREKVRAFLIKYQDRLLYAVDQVLFPWQDQQSQLQAWEDLYARDWKYFATGETVQLTGRNIQGALLPEPVAIQGLALPEPVLRKLFHDNAMHWVPGIAGSP